MSEKESYFQACLEVIRTEGWANFTFTKAAERTGHPLSGFYQHFNKPTDIMAEIMRRVDQEVIQNTYPLDSALSPRDRLFEVMMLRFDTNQPYKEVISAFWREGIYDLSENLALIKQCYQSMVWMLEIAGIDSHGIKGSLRAKALMILYLLTLNTWLGDESADSAKTMAFLDRGLKQLESMALSLQF